MTNDVQNNILTQLRAIREEVADLKNRISNLETGQESIIQYISNLANKITQVQVAMDRQTTRIERIARGCKIQLTREKAL